MRKKQERITNSYSYLNTLIKSSKLDGILISSVATIVYLTDFAYFSTHEKEAFLLYTPKNRFIMTDGRYSEAVGYSITDWQLCEISPEQPLKDIVKKLIKKHSLERIGFEANDLTVEEYKRFSKYVKKMIPISLSSMRIKKTPSEIKKIEKACAIGDKAFLHILSHLKTGITEKEVSLQLEMYIRQHDAELSFNPIVAFGKNSSIPHHKTSTQKLEKNMVVLLDFGVKVENYCSDMTRTIIFGKATPKQKKIYQTVLKAQEKAFECLNFEKGIPVAQIDSAARAYIISQGYPSIPHSLGHGIGIEVHELPVLSPRANDILSDGMVFSIEPGIYIASYGGVRIEDLVAIENNKPRFLTHAPKDLIELS